MSGAGLQKAGKTSAGFGTSSEATVFEGGFLRDEITGETLGARLINPKTKGFVLDSNGRLLGMKSVRQAVLIAIHTVRDSSAVRGLGNRLSSIDRIGSNIERQILNILSEALAPLVQAGLVEVVGFSQFKAGDGKNGMLPGAVFGRFRWKDLTTKQPYEEII